MVNALVMRPAQLLHARGAAWNRKSFLAQEFGIKHISDFLLPLKSASTFILFIHLIRHYFCIYPIGIA